MILSYSVSYMIIVKTASLAPLGYWSLIKLMIKNVKYVLRSIQIPCIVFNMLLLKAKFFLVKDFSVFLSHPISALTTTTLVCQHSDTGSAINRIAGAYISENSTHYILFAGLNLPRTKIRPKHNEGVV